MSDRLALSVAFWPDPAKPGHNQLVLDLDLTVTILVGASLAVMRHWDNPEVLKGFLQAELVTEWHFDVAAVQAAITAWFGVERFIDLRMQHFTAKYAVFPQDALFTEYRKQAADRIASDLFHILGRHDVSLWHDGVEEFLRRLGTSGHTAARFHRLASQAFPPVSSS